MPRNFPGRSGTADDQVYLCSPETAVVSALEGKITNPQDFSSKMDYPKFEESEKSSVNKMMLIPPSANDSDTELRKGPNIKSLPDFGKIEDSFSVPVILKMGDNISTDEILKAGADVLPLRSNIEAISHYAFYQVDTNFYDKANKAKESHGGHIVVGGENYAQGSSREHAAIAPRFLGQRAVIAKSYARIGFQNMVNFGIIPFLFKNPKDYALIDEQAVLVFNNIWDAVENGTTINVLNTATQTFVELFCNLTSRQKKVLLAGGLINFLKQKN